MQLANENTVAPIELSHAERIELSYLQLKGFTYLVRNEIGSVEVFINKPHRNKVTNGSTHGGLDVWVERAFPMSQEEMFRRRETSLGKYEFIRWSSEPMSIAKLLADTEPDVMLYRYFVSYVYIRNGNTGYGNLEHQTNTAITKIDHINKLAETIRQNIRATGVTIMNTTRFDEPQHTTH